MKALLISGIYRPEIGGPATYLPALAQVLINQKSTVEVVTLKNSSSNPVIEKWPVNYVNRNQFLLIRFIKTFLLIRRKGKNSDVIFANGLFQETAIALLLMNKRSVAKIVGDPVWERARNKGLTNLNIVEFNRAYLRINQRFQRWLIKWSLNRFTLITCPSLELKSLIENWGVKSPIKFIANGIVLMEVKKIEKQFDVISVCRLVTWKNLDKLIFACAKANCTLAIVGSGPEELKLKSLANSLGAKVTFFGQLSEPQVINCLQKSKVFALLSDYEGLSFSLLQAMASELPVIVSNVKGNTDVISDGKDGIVVDLNNEDSIFNAIKSLLSSNEKITTLGKGALKKVQKDYLQENQINKVIALLS